MSQIYDCRARSRKAPALWLNFLLRRLSVAALCLILPASATSLEDSPVSEPACSSSVCVINVIARNLIVAPCQGYSVLVAYSQSSPATLIQCSKPGHEDESKLLIYSRKSAAAKSYVIEGSRFLRPDSLQVVRDEGISSGFGKVKLCAENQGARAESGDLLIAEKQPNNSDTGPYCYRITNVRMTDGSFEFVGHARLPAPSTETKRWAAMRRRLAPYLRED